ncbi:hypothetical protein [Actinacidiphila glaucinigra]
MAHRFPAGSGAAVLPASRGPMPWGRACAPPGLTGLRERAAALGGTWTRAPSRTAASWCGRHCRRTPAGDRPGDL